MIKRTGVWAYRIRPPCGRTYKEIAAPPNVKRIGVGAYRIRPDVSEHDICLLILFLGLFVDSVDHVEHGVAGHHVVAGLGAALGVDRAVDV